MGRRCFSNHRHFKNPKVVDILDMCDALDLALRDSETAYNDLTKAEELLKKGKIKEGLSTIHCVKSWLLNQPMDYCGREDKAALTAWILRNKLEECQ